MRGGQGQYSNYQKNKYPRNKAGFPQKKEIHISKETKEKADLAKVYIQGKDQYFWV